ncbi:FAD-dependent oxidoreductase [Eggerthella sinensis]|uniref:FAD-dependent oxidoreductase n=1 Tax=Eggerthella sinensis TaxID=242230 RepID=UPI00248E8649|nr:FAD-dependent oxidoreductase [Eggerthella sinensis]
MKEQGTARNMSRRSFMALTAIAGVQTAVFGLSGCAPKGSSTESGTGFKPGTYTGTGEGKFGTVVVETTFSEEGITNIALTDHEETERVSDRAIEEVPAAIIEYQSLDVDTVTGATLTSAAIIAGVTDCVKQAGSAKGLANTYEPAALSTEVVDVEADFVIAGAGAAGMAAAVAAASNGASKVVVLEKGSNIGGNALVSGGYLEYVHAPANLRVPMTPELTNQLEADLSNELVAQIDPKYVDKIKEDYAAYLASGDTTLFDSEELMALQESLQYGPEGYEGSLSFAQCVSAYDAFLDENGFKWKPCIGIVGYPWPHWSAPDDGVCGQGYFNFFDKQIEENDYPVEVLLNTPVTELLKEGDRVVGFKAVAEDGTTYNVRGSHGALLATGGFSGNPDMLREYNTMWPWDDKTPLPTTNVYGHHGDGIKLALEEGAAVDLMDSLMMFPFADVKNGADETTVGSDVDCLLVNANGERFVDETVDRYTMTAALMEQPDEILFLISDKDTSRIEGDKSYYGRSIQRLLDQGQLYQADTLEDLATQMGADPATFKATVERYNEIARSGEDPDFGRMIFTSDSPIENPPFYASPRTWAAHITEGGVVTDDISQVVREDGTPIEGLYAAGEVTVGMSGVSSMALGYAVGEGVFSAA